MLQALQIEGLRGIASADLQELSPLTILVGPNGSAKSTVLEAAGVACAGSSVAAVIGALIKREWLGLSGLGHVLPRNTAKVKATFSDYSTSGVSISQVFESEVRLDALDDRTVASVSRELGKPVAVVHLRRSPHLVDGWIDDDGNIATTGYGTVQAKFELLHAFVDRPAGAAQRFSRPRFSSALREALGLVKLSPLYDEVFANIQALRPSLVSIESVPVGDRDEPFMFEKTPAGRVGYPVAFAGDGFRRTLLLAAGFAAAEKGVVAIDEPDAFAHPTMFERLAGLIRRSVDQGTQVLYATHNMEFIGATLRAFKDKLDALSVFGLQLVDGQLDYVRIPGADAERRVHELGHDLRL